MELLVVVEQRAVEVGGDQSDIGTGTEDRRLEVHEFGFESGTARRSILLHI
jgi:hypothetical protein